MSADRQTIAELYGLTAAQLTPLPGGNFSKVYAFERDGLPGVLRVAPAEGETVRSKEAICAWLAYLDAQGAPAPRPIESQRGRIVETVAGETGQWIVTAERRCRGKPAEDLPLEAVNGALIERLGQAVGKMHALSKTYVPARAELRRPDWDQIHNVYNPPDRPGRDQAGVRERQRQVLGRIRGLPKTPDGYGLVHADLHWGNFLVERETGAVALIDFDDCAYGWYIMDIALPWLDMLVLHPAADQMAEATWFLDHFLRGYRTENDLAPFWVEQLPDCLAWLEISLYLRMAPEYDPDIATGWVRAFMAGRRERIEGGQPVVGGLGRVLAAKDR